jgi:hypothetical protein
MLMLSMSHVPMILNSERPSAPVSERRELSLLIADERATLQKQIFGSMTPATLSANNASSILPSSRRRRQIAFAESAYPKIAWRRCL